MTNYFNSFSGNAVGQIPSRWTRRLDTAHTIETVEHARFKGGLVLRERQRNE